MKFNELIKNEGVLKALSDLELITPTKIQEDIIPLILDGNDVFGQSQTGTGKTIAFALPILENVEANKKVQALILTPTRELAIQIEREFTKLSTNLNINTIAVYGNSSIEEQIKYLRNGCEVVVGTPGRTKDLIKRNVLKLSEIKYFVLDEADEMLSMGFQEELEYIFEKINNDKQVLLFSATMSQSILNIAKKYMSSDYKTVSLSKDQEIPKNVSQEYCIVNNRERLESLSRIIDYYNPKKCMIFCRTKRNADDVIDKLVSKGYNAAVIHGDITQSQRIKTLDQFKSGAFNYLIATDVAARGIHVDDVDIVINYNLPESNEAYVHRIGRTGRVNKRGLAITLIMSNEEKIIRSIEKTVKSKITKKELPNQQEILEKTAINIIDNINELKCTNKENSIFKEYLDSLSFEDTKIILNKLLEKEMFKSVGSDFSKNISIKSKKERSKERISKDSTRVFMTIGKMDNIEKRTLLCFLEKTANVKEGTISKVDILTKFTFANVNNKDLSTVLKKCNNVRYNGHVIKIEIAKK